MIAASDDLMALVLEAFEQGLAAIAESAAPGKLVPFVLRESPGGRLGIAAFQAASEEEAREHARSAVRALGRDVARAVVAYEGHVSLDGERFLAIFAEGHERGSSSGCVFAQRYAVAEGVAGVVGNPGYCGDVEPLLGT